MTWWMWCGNFVGGDSCLLFVYQAVKQNCAFLCFWPRIILVAIRI